MPRPGETEALDAEARALWRRVTESVKPLARPASAPPSIARTPQPVPLRTAARPPRAGPRVPTPVLPARPAPPSDTLDGGWDRRLRRGTIAPDRSVDLHGHSLAAAHAALDQALARAIADEARVLLVVTGKPPREGASARGLIRAQIGDWLAASPHAGRLAAVRAAHPRHGGAGALYLILRRRRET